MSPLLKVKPLVAALTDGVYYTFNRADNTHYRPRPQILSTLSQEFNFGGEGSLLNECYCSVSITVTRRLINGLIKVYST